MRYVRVYLHVYCVSGECICVYVRARECASESVLVCARVRVIESVSAFLSA